MTKQQRLVLLVSILASFVAFLDGSVVNVALPAMMHELGGGLAFQQWVVNAYTITLGSLMLIAGSFSDMFGRKLVLRVGLLGFLVASVLCAISPSSYLLVASRALQGVAGALLVPSSLALIMSVFSGKAQGKAIGTWTAWTGIAFIIGPLLGGFLVDTVSWRLIFAINVLPVVVTLWLMGLLDMVHDTETSTKIDRLGSVLCALGLAGPVYGLIEQPTYGWANPRIYLSLTVGLLLLATFLWHENHTAKPMLPLGLFKIRNFGFGNIATLFIYGGLAVSSFLITIFIQQTGGFSALRAGLSLLPITIFMFLLSPRFGALSGRYGPRLFMTAGPLVAALGFLAMARVNVPVEYWTRLLPGIVLFGLGLSMTVAPLTSAVLGSINSRQAGIGSAVNNAVSRIAGLLAISAIGLVTGPHLTTMAFHRGIVTTAILLALGGIVSAIGIRNDNVVSPARGES